MLSCFKIWYRGRAFGKSLRCSFQGDNNLGYDIPGAFILITLLYGSCVGDDKNHEYDIPGAEPVSLKPLKILSKIVSATSSGMASSWDTEGSTASNNVIHVEFVHGALSKKPRNA